MKLRLSYVGINTDSFPYDVPVDVTEFDNIAFTEAQQFLFAVGQIQIGQMSHSTIEPDSSKSPNEKVG